AERRSARYFAFESVVPFACVTVQSSTRMRSSVATSACARASFHRVSIACISSATVGAAIECVGVARAPTGRCDRGTATTSSRPVRSRMARIIIAAVRSGLSLLFAAVMTTTVSAQIATDLVEKRKADFHLQATDADMKREGGTQPRDWDYNLPDGVTTRQITFYVDGGTPLYGKLFFPKGFKLSDRRPAVVVGHGINALTIVIEKYAARFAERGLVAMAIDYQSYGFSGSGSDDLKLLEADPTTDVQVLADKKLRVVVKRTNLNNAHEVDDYRAAISYLQGEPGVDPDGIGLWGSSNAGSVVIAVAAIDARAKAVVSQVASPRPVPRGPAPPPTAAQAAMVDDAIKRARTGQGAEVDGGFSFKS